MKTQKIISKYKIIENDIIDKINLEIYLPDQPLPTEYELTEIYHCSRVTVRQALCNLENRGFIRKEHGSGSFVNKTKTIQRTPQLKSFTEDIEELGKVPKSVVHAFNILKAGNEMSRILNLSTNDQIYYIERTRFANDDPVLFERTFMSVALHSTLSMSHLLGSKFKYAKECNFKIDYAHQNISPIFPSEYIAKELRIAVDQPIIRIINITYCEDGTVFDYTELYLHPELYQLNIVKKMIQT